MTSSQFFPKARQFIEGFKVTGTGGSFEGLK
jgi:hypothetical protein